jgi:hypothetical protein
MTKAEAVLYSLSSSVLEALGTPDSERAADSTRSGGCRSSPTSCPSWSLSRPVAAVDEERGVRLRQTRLAASPRGRRLKTVLDILFFDASFLYRLLLLYPQLRSCSGLLQIRGPDVTLPSHRNVACPQATSCIKCRLGSQGLIIHRRNCVLLLSVSCQRN